MSYFQGYYEQDYSWRAEAERAVNELDARLTALEAKPQESPAPEASDLFVAKTCNPFRAGWCAYETATPAQVRAEYERLCTDEVVVTREFWKQATRLMNEPQTPREKVAEAFLHAALLDPMNMQEYTIEYLAEWLRSRNDGRLTHMAAVLEKAAKEEGK